jgi:hypothetical protein
MLGKTIAIMFNNPGHRISYLYRWHHFSFAAKELVFICDETKYKQYVNRGMGLMKLLGNRSNV